MKQISTAVGLWYKMNTQADMVDGPGWWLVMVPKW